MIYYRGKECAAKEKITKDELLKELNAKELGDELLKNVAGGYSEEYERCVGRQTEEFSIRACSQRIRPPNMPRTRSRDAGRRSVSRSRFIATHRYSGIKP